MYCWHFEGYLNHLPYVPLPAAGRHFSNPDARLGFRRGFFDGGGVGLMPAYTNTDVELLEYNRQLLAELGVSMSPLIIWERRVANDGIRGKSGG
ncbi:hypothetical protein HRbin02_01285 [Candidatus Calditenuaceae archaeon HR02]|nr:hypothetical protein HRbin02_01285 [Candidatus Calditenuaceae archaeon HR02]